MQLCHRGSHWERIEKRCVYAAASDLRFVFLTINGQSDPHAELYVFAETKKWYKQIIISSLHQLISKQSLSNRCIKVISPSRPCCYTEYHHRLLNYRPLSDKERTKGGGTCERSTQPASCWISSLVPFIQRTTHDTRRWMNYERITKRMLMTKREKKSTISQIVGRVDCYTHACPLACPLACPRCLIAWHTFASELRAELSKKERSRSTLWSFSLCLFDAPCGNKPADLGIQRWWCRVLKRMCASPRGCPPPGARVSAISAREPVSIPAMTEHICQELGCKIPNEHTCTHAHTDTHEPV